MNQGLALPPRRRPYRAGDRGRRTARSFVQAEKRVLPGYVLVNIDLDDDAWGVVKNTPGVTGFVGRRRQADPARSRKSIASSVPAPRSAIGRVPRWNSPRRVGEGNLRAAGLRRRDRRRPAGLPEAQSPRGHLRAPGAGGARFRPGEEDRLDDDHHPLMAKEGSDTHQAADPGRAGEPCAAGRPCARPARREHHGVLQGVQRPDAAGERPDHPGRDHGLFMTGRSTSSPRRRRPPS